MRICCTTILVRGFTQYETFVNNVCYLLPNHPYSFYISNQLQQLKQNINSLPCRNRQKKSVPNELESFDVEISEQQFEMANKCMFCWVMADIGCSIRYNFRLYNILQAGRVMTDSGILECSDFAQMWCIIRIIQCVIAGSLICGCLTEIILTLKAQGGLQINTKIMIEILMLLSLMFNFAHILDDGYDVQYLMYLQLFFANLFFLTIFYYVGDNILKGRPARVLLHLFLVGMVAFYVSVLVLRILKDIYCVDEKILYIAVDSVSIFISFLIFFLFCNRYQEERRMQLYYTVNLVSLSSAPPRDNLNNPFIRMWVLIGTNVFCGITNLVYTVVLYSIRNCQLQQDKNLNVLYKFLFLFFDYYLGAAVTLVVLSRIRLNETDSSLIAEHPRSQSFTHEVSEPNKLEMIANSSRSSNF